MSRQAKLPHCRTVHRITAAALTLLLLIQTTGCVSWQPETNPVPSLHIAKATDTYRIILSGGMAYRLTNVRIRDDSVFGIVSLPPGSTGGERPAGTSVSFPVSQVSSVERRSDDSGKAAVAAIAFIGALGIMMSIAMKDAWSTAWR